MNELTLDSIIQDKREELGKVKERMLVSVRESEASAPVKALVTSVLGNTGKMIRPLMTLLAGGDCDPSKKDELLWAAAAGEMLHTASLILDDVIDGAVLRRGKPSLPAERGSGVAVSAGTFLISAACSCLTQRGYTESASRLLRVIRLVSDGEMLQDLHRYDTHVSEELYMRCIEGKTAEPFAWSGSTAAMISGKDVTAQTIMSMYGTAFGTVFQLEDDIRDWTMTAEEAGKPVLADFRNGIYTLPAIHTFHDRTYGGKLRSLAEKKDSIPEEKLYEAKEIVRMAGGIDYARESAETKKKEAVSVLSMLPDGRYITDLRALIRSRW